MHQPLLQILENTLTAITHQILPALTIHKAHRHANLIHAAPRSQDSNSSHPMNNHQAAGQLFLETPELSIGIKDSLLHLITPSDSCNFAMRNNCKNKQCNKGRKHGEFVGGSSYHE